MKIWVVGIACLVTFLQMGIAGHTEAMQKSQQQFCLLGDEKTQRISTSELKTHLSDPAWIIIDVRRNSDLEADPARIAGAVREDFMKTAHWAAKYSKDKNIVLYCA